MMIRTQVQLTERQLAALREQAARLGVSVSDLVRRAVDTWVLAQPGPPQSEVRRRALEAAGKYASGRSDVARRHDEHLAETYG